MKLVGIIKRKCLSELEAGLRRRLPVTNTIINNNLVKSSDASQVIKNCLFFCAYSPLVEGELKRQARDLLDLISGKGLFPGAVCPLCQDPGFYTVLTAEEVKK